MLMDLTRAVALNVPPGFTWLLFCRLHGDIPCVAAGLSVRRDPGDKREPDLQLRVSSPNAAQISEATGHLQTRERGNKYLLLL